MTMSFLYISWRTSDTTSQSANHDENTSKEWFAHSGPDGGEETDHEIRNTAYTHLNSKTYNHKHKTN